MSENKIITSLKDHPIASFFILAYAITWVSWLPATLGQESFISQLGFLIGGFGPAVSALVVIYFTGGSVREWAEKIIHWRVDPKWYIAAFGIPVLLVLVVTIEFLLLGNDIDLSVLPQRLVAYAPSLVFIALVGGGNEEPGWRGFALPRLQEKLSPVLATLLLGLIWAFWHLPLLLADPHVKDELMASPADFLPLVFLTLIGILGYSFYYTWLYNRTQSVLLCIIMHAGFNTANSLLYPLSEEALHGDIYPLLLFLTTLTLFLGVGVLITLTKGRLGYAIESTEQIDPADSESYPTL